MIVLILSVEKRSRTPFLQVGCKNRTSHPYKGHYDPWLTSELAQLRVGIFWTGPTSFNDADPLGFSATHEVFGITAIPPETRDAYNILPAPNPVEPNEKQTILDSSYPFSLATSNSHLSGSRYKRHAYLAAAQQTKYAVTSIHTPEEYALFNSALSTGGVFAVQNGKKPKFEDMARWWSGKVDGTTIFYKLPESLESHFKKWSERREELTSLTMGETQREANRARVSSRTHTARVLPASNRLVPGAPVHGGVPVASKQVVRPTTVSVDQSEISPAPVAPVTQVPVITTSLASSSVAVAGHHTPLATLSTGSAMNPFPFPPVLWNPTSTGVAWPPQWSAMMPGFYQWRVQA